MGVALDVTFWVTIFLATSGELFITLYTLILFSDLLMDHVNPIELCARVNGLAGFTIGMHAGMTALLLLRAEWAAVALNLPLLGWHVVTVRRGSHLLDNTRIFGSLGRERRVAEVKLGFFLVSFFFYLYRFIMMLLEVA